MRNIWYTIAVYNSKFTNLTAYMEIVYLRSVKCFHTGESDYVEARTMKKKKPVVSEDVPVQLSLPLDGCRKCGQPAKKEYRDGYCEKCSAEILLSSMAQMGR